MEDPFRLSYLQPLKNKSATAERQAALLTGWLDDALAGVFLLSLESGSYQPPEVSVYLGIDLIFT
jgi:hypothetical protein